ncbi:MAG: flavin reductase family protein [Methanomassiliicoccales archaeon]|nr:flavin reductase family protein [Methanomassiliicoccales archaeon]
MDAKTEVNPIWACRGFPAFPVVLVAVGNAKEKVECNVMTVVLVHMFSFDPPVIGVGVSPCRYTFDLMNKHDEFTVNIPGKELVEEVLFCGQKCGRETNKFEECGFTVTPGKVVNAPIIEECLVNLECKKRQVIDAGDHVWFLGEVVHGESVQGELRERAILYWGGEFRVIGNCIRKR